MIGTIYRNGVLIGYSKVTRDLTERKATEARFLEAYEESSRLKSEFLAITSHEVRTPMHGMLSALTLLRHTGLDERQDELALIIENSSSILLQVINDILDYSKLASGTFSIAIDQIPPRPGFWGAVVGTPADVTPTTRNLGKWNVQGGCGVSRHSLFLLMECRSFQVIILGSQTTNLRMVRYSHTSWE